MILRRSLPSLVLGVTLATSFATPLAAQGPPIAPAPSILFEAGHAVVPSGQVSEDPGLNFWQGGAIGAGVGAGAAMGLLYLVADGRCDDCAASSGRSRLLAYGVAAGVGAFLGFIIGGSIADDR